MSRAARPCSTPNCPNLKPCPQHARKPWATRPSRMSYATAEWKRVRLFVLDRDGHTCQECGAPGNEAGHIVPAAARPDLALEPGNLRTLCQRCNHIEASRKGGQGGRR